MVLIEYRAVIRKTNAVFVAFAVLAGGLAGQVGCGGSSGIPEGIVQGQVTYQGKPVQQGVVTFYSSELGIGISEELRDGKYLTQQPIQTGEYVVSIFPPSEPPPEEATPLTVRREFPEIPHKYRNPRQSGLMLEVKEGVNSYDVEMVP